MTTTTLLPSYTTPWGTPDHVEQIAEGIVLASTPSHGGFYLTPDRNAQIPAAWRAASWNGQGERGWYEEDCDWCLVALTFPDLFPNEMEMAHATFRHFFA